MDNEAEVLFDHHTKYKTPNKTGITLDNEKLLDKINQLTTKPENSSCNARVPTIKDFVVIKPISRGAFGKVFLGYKNSDPNKFFAIKVMRKSEMINKNMVSQVINERNALALSRSPFCVSLFYSLQSSNYVYLVMDYMVGGDLKSLLAMYGYFDEAAARFYTIEVALALQYLHNHGIVHRDIKPDNMLLSSTGHVKLTDFGLSKIDMKRGDLEISDLINCSPNLNTRTPGQLLSLTSHLSFGSEKKLECGTGTSHFITAINKHCNAIESSDSEADTSLNEAEKNNESKISGVSPFFSAEDINTSTGNACNLIESSSSYHTCESSEFSKISSSCTVQSDSYNKENNNNNDINGEIKVYCNGCDMKKYQVALNDGEQISIENERVLAKGVAIKDETIETCEFEMMKPRCMDERITLSLKQQEDSGVSSRKSDCSNSHINGENATSLCIPDKTDNSKHCDYSTSDYSRSSNINNTNEISGIRMHSPFPNISRHFKRPEILSNSSMRGLKRKINMVNRFENTSNSEGDGSVCSMASSTGLTQEMDVIDIGSSTPKKRRARTSPIRGVLKVRSLSDDEMMPQIITDNGANVVFSTPVSSQKLPRRDCGLLGKLKSTRFTLPLSVEMNKKENIVDKLSTVQYLKMAHEDPTMSPINLNANTLPKTPKTKINTPFRTPKSVRRAAGYQLNERILGTPDYLAPELLLKLGHGPAVDWWALGVCFYEFLTGVPPFNDETPQKVFENILHKNIEWPEGDEALSEEAMMAVDQLLTMDPMERPSAKQVQQMPFFASIDWHNIENVMPPFIPNPDDPTDTAYFEARNNLQHLKLSNFVVDD